MKLYFSTKGENIYSPRLKCYEGVPFMTKLHFRKESIPYIIILVTIGIILYFLFPITTILPVIVLLFVVYFFRDPERNISDDEYSILSAADGTVMDICEIDEDTYIGGKAIKVSIFLSLFNVHVNRSPISGTVKYKSYRPGKYLPAFKSHASELNERNTIGIENEKTKVLVHQLTGLVARRIVCWSKENDTLKQGERFGLIKFGSCTEIIMPCNVDIKVKKCDVVRGGITVIGVIK
jgi:phosphatidylserine decarboxylase